MLTTNAARLRLVLAAILFSTGGAAIKATTLTAWQVAGFRSGVAALALFLLLPESRRGWSWRTLLVGIAYAATLMLFVVANKLTTSANTIFLQSTSPLYILILSPLLLREPIRARDVVFMGAVGLGLALFFVEREAPLATAPDPVLGNMLAAVSGITWAFTVIGLRWLGTHGEQGTAFPAMVSGNLTVLLVALPLALPVVSSTPTDWVVIAFLGLFQIGFAYMMLARGIRHVSALEASVLLLVEPALNPLWSWIVHAEAPSAWALAGAAVIFGATTLRTWYESRLAAA
ncbi:MAG TPA: DMT family transporter [Gemmatimonadales bacterium]|nr:DMT family transporter [Gemmatimonadales bacterium]